MRSSSLISLICVLFLAGCQPEPTAIDPAFTGNQTTYDLQPGSSQAVRGIIVFKERKDGAVTATIELQGISGKGKFPVHLHFGDLSTDNADIALLLYSVDASTGRSETTFSMLADESPFTYKQLAAFDGCIKIHLGSTGADRNIILAAGNIGASFTKSNPTGRTGIAVCKSE